ncbi:hypothetical protein [Rhodovarius sp.]|uniref:hypothetical protein n=1 Tax=Rhodovarius sp. TaxID=2972673 RepID=UPI00333E4EE1
MANAATIGLTFERGGQLYACIAIRPHRRPDGGASQIAVWNTRCCDCGEAFETTTTTSLNRGAETRRCSVHRAPGKRVTKLSPAASGQNTLSALGGEAASGFAGLGAGNPAADDKTALAEGGAV